MNRFMFTVTVATSVLLGAANTYAQTVLYTPPGTTVTEAQPLPLGQSIAGRITDKNATEFKSWLASSDIKQNFDVKKGYTVFALVDSDFDPSKPEKPIEHYIVNDRVGMTTMHGNSDTVKAMNGDEVEISRTGDSYYADGKRINGVIKNPEGTIYLIGGPVSAFTL